MKRKTGKEDLKIVWTDQAKSAVKSIFFYKDKSPQGAVKVRDELLESPKRIVFAAQYQVDDVNPRYRRIVVRDFKVLYRVNNSTIQVMDVVSTKRSPKTLRNNIENR